MSPTDAALAAPPAPASALRPAAPPLTASRLFWSGSLAFVAVGALSALYGAALPVWAGRWGLTDAQGGALMSCHFGGAVLVVLARLAGLIELRLRGGLLAVTLGTLGLAAGWGWGWTLASAAVAGVGFGVVVTSVNGRFLAEFGARGPGMVGLVNAISAVGAIAAPLLMLAWGGGPGPAFAGAAILTAAAALLAAPERGAPPAPTAPAAPGRPLRAVAPLLLFITGGVMLEVMLTAYGALALVEAGRTEAGAARLVSAFFATFLAARLSLAWLAPRVAADRLFLASLVGTAAATGLAALGWAATGFVVAGAAVGLTFPTFFVWAARLLGEGPRAASAVLVASLAGGMLGPLVIRPVVAWTGAGATWGLVAGFALLLALLFAALRPRPA